MHWWFWYPFGGWAALNAEILALLKNYLRYFNLGRTGPRAAAQRRRIVQ